MIFGIPQYHVKSASSFWMTSWLSLEDGRGAGRGHVKETVIDWCTSYTAVLCDGWSSAPAEHFTGMHTIYSGKGDWFGSGVSLQLSLTGRNLGYKKHRIYYLAEEELLVTSIESIVNTVLMEASQSVKEQCVYFTPNFCFSFLGSLMPALLFSVIQCA